MPDGDESSHEEDGARTALPPPMKLLPRHVPDCLVLGSHKGKAVRRAIRAAGARLFFLPKYSPDLNPIEQLFSKLKHWLKKAASRTVQTVCDAIGQTLNRITPTECSHYFENSGYDGN